MITNEDSRIPVGALLAAVQVHGGTRVIVATTYPVPGCTEHRFTLIAYDSAHPHDDRFMASGPCASGRDLRAARVWAHRSLTPPGGCGCWSGWDPWCGRGDCWGVGAAELAKAGAR